MWQSCCLIYGDQSLYLVNCTKDIEMNRTVIPSRNIFREVWVVLYVRWCPACWLSSDQSGLSKVQLWPLKVLLLIIISSSPRMPSYSLRNSVWKDSTSMAWVHVITACIFLWLSIEGIDCSMAHNHVLQYIISQNCQYCTVFQEMMLFVHHFSYLPSVH